MQLQLLLTLARLIVSPVGHILEVRRLAVALQCEEEPQLLLSLPSVVLDLEQCL